MINMKKTVSLRRLLYLATFIAVVFVFLIYPNTDPVSFFAIPAQDGCPTWPKLELFMPVAAVPDSIDELRKFFLPSFQLFWPIRQSRTTLLLIEDEEQINSLETRNLKELINASAKNVPLRTAYNRMPQLFVGNHMIGHDRQQWLMFWADNFTSADYVGFVDTDTVFISRVALPDLFDIADPKRPVVRPLYGEPHRAGWAGVPASTSMAIGKPSPMRAHIVSQMNETTFDEAFLRITQMLYGQFDIMCSYLWYFHREDYVWAIGQRDPDWTGPLPIGQVATMAEAGITPRDLDQHGPRIAMHWGVDPDLLKKIFQLGVCFGMLEDDPNLLDYCPAVLNFASRTSQINENEWYFEGYRLTLKNDKWALSAHQRRLAVNDKCFHEWNMQQVSEIIANVYDNVGKPFLTTPAGVVKNHVILAPH